MLTTALAEIRKRISQIAYKPGVHTSTYLRAAGFQYTGVDDTTCCDECKLAVSNWTKDMNPFKVHAEREPTCPFVLSLQSPVPLPPAVFRDQFIPAVRNSIPPERQAIEANDSPPLTSEISEHTSLETARLNTFSHWPLKDGLSSKHMIKAGFFCCNTNDRVMCIYCNMICQRWTPHADNPIAVHKTLSPNCPFVQSKLMHRGPIETINDRINGSTNNNISAIRMSQNVQPSQQHQNNNRLDIDSSILGDYFHILKANNINCPDCGDLLSYAASENSPLLAHARRNPHCSYILRWSTVESIRAALHLAYARRRTPMTREEMISKRIQAGMALPMSQELLRTIPANIIRQCWEDQIKIKSKLKIKVYSFLTRFFFIIIDEQFHLKGDLYIACLIRQKQDRHINGDESRIIVPSERMREHEQNAVNAHRRKTRMQINKEMISLDKF